MGDGLVVTKEVTNACLKAFLRKAVCSRVQQKIAESVAKQGIQSFIVKRLLTLSP